MAVTYRHKARASGCRTPAASPPERGSVRKLRWPRPGSSPASSVSPLRPITPRSSPRRPNRVGYQPGLCNKADEPIKLGRGFLIVYVLALCISLWLLHPWSANDRYTAVLSVILFPFLVGLIIYSLGLF